jgi:hypothetical protein
MLITTWLVFNPIRSHKHLSPSKKRHRHYCSDAWKGCCNKNPSIINRRTSKERKENDACHNRDISRGIGSQTAAAGTRCSCSRWAWTCSSSTPPGHASARECSLAWRCMLGMTCYPSWWLAFFYHFFNSFLVLTRGGKLHVISGRRFHIGSIRGVNHIYALTG